VSGVHDHHSFNVAPDRGANLPIPIAGGLATAFVFGKANNFVEEMLNPPSHGARAAGKAG
jgi:hypothetical protein